MNEHNQKLLSKNVSVNSQLATEEEKNGLEEQQTNTTTCLAVNKLHWHGLGKKKQLPMSPVVECVWCGVCKYETMSAAF